MKQPTKKSSIAGVQHSLCSVGLGHSFIIVGFVLLLIIGYSSPAQNFSIDWFTIDGGGGTSTGGVFSVSGTIGQPDAGRMSGGNFTLEGGFWGIIGAIQTPGSPLLSVLLTTTNTVIISWPAPSSFSLQQNSNLLTTNWATASPLPSVTGTNNVVTNATTLPGKLYRLHK